MWRVNAIQRIHAERVVAVLDAAGDPTAVVEGLLAGGLSVVEVPLVDNAALGRIARLAAREDVCVLAGGVRTAAQADAALAAGAHGCLGPSLVVEVLERCVALGAAGIPGAFTPTELEQAWALGASMVRVFPAALDGAGYLRALHAALPNVPILAAGELRLDQVAEVIAAGAVAVSLGPGLVDAPDVAAAARQVSASLA